MSVREKNTTGSGSNVLSKAWLIWSPIPLGNCSHAPRIVVLQNEEMLETEKGRLESEKLQWTQARSDE